MTIRVNILMLYAAVPARPASALTYLFRQRRRRSQLELGRRSLSRATAQTVCGNSECSGLFAPPVVTSEASRLAAEWQPHLALVDMELGGGGLLDRLRGLANPIPVIALTRRGGLEAKLDAFERGVEDILSRPFSPEELVARTLVAVRRIYHEDVAFTSVIQVSDLEIDILHRRTRAGAYELHLTSVELSLLYLFVANSGRLLTRAEILENLWGIDFAESNLIDRFASGWTLDAAEAVCGSDDVAPETGRPPRASDERRRFDSQSSSSIDR